MKTVYFVRHGESESNTRTQTTHKGQFSALTEKGKRQAEMIAARAAEISFEVLLSSPWTRARGTAEAISRKTGKPVEYSDLFTEARAPSSLDGLELTNPLLVEKLKAWHRLVFSPSERIEDGENFSDLKERAEHALRHLLGRTETKIMVATHGLFLKMLIATVLFGESLTPEMFYRFVSATKTEHTGITVFTYGTLSHHETDDGLRWRLRVFNDHAHLG